MIIVFVWSDIYRALIKIPTSIIQSKINRKEGI